MASRLAVLLALVSLLCLALASNASAAQGLAGQRVVERPERTTWTATTGPLIAPSTACPDQSTLTAPVAAQEEAMRCMTDFARTSAGLGALADAEELDQSARAKAEDVLRCDSFSHFACGREFTYWIREAGYIGEQCRTSSATTARSGSAW